MFDLWILLKKCLSICKMVFDHYHFLRKEHPLLIALGFVAQRVIIVFLAPTPRVRYPRRSGNIRNKWSWLVIVHNNRN